VVSLVLLSTAVLTVGLLVADAGTAAAGHPAKQPVGDSRQVTVYAVAHYDLPVKTSITIRYDGGNCTKDESGQGAGTTYPLTKPGESDYAMRATAKSGQPWESCAYEKSDARFVVTVKTPNGTTRSVQIDLAQKSSPNALVRTYGVDCGSGNLPCSSHGSVTVPSKDGIAVAPEVSFGPVSPDPPAPSPPLAPSLVCTGSIQAKAGVPIVDAHICTADGNPLPTLSYISSTLPTSVVVPSRWPTSADTWIVLNGTLPDTGQFNLRVQASIGSWTDVKYVWVYVS